MNVGAKNVPSAFWHLYGPNAQTGHEHAVADAMAKIATYLPQSEARLCLMLGRQQQSAFALSAEFPDLPGEKIVDLPAWPLFTLLAEMDRSKEGIDSPQLFVVLAVLVCIRDAYHDPAVTSLGTERLKKLLQVVRWIRENHRVRVAIDSIIGKAEEGSFDRGQITHWYFRISAIAKGAPKLIDKERLRTLLELLEAARNSQLIKVTAENLRLEGDGAGKEAGHELVEHGDLRATASNYDSTSELEELDDESEDADLVPTDREVLDRKPVRHQVYLDNRFSEHYRDHFTILEAKYSAKLIKGSRNDVRYRRSAILLELQGLTGQSLVALSQLRVVHALSDEGQIDLQGRIRVLVPGGKGFWRAHAWNLDLPDSNDHWDLALPPDLVKHLQLELLLGKPLFSEENIVAAAREYAREVIRPEVSRFSETRWRSSLPISLYQCCRDQRLVQLITGDGHALSAPPLHYLAVKTDTLQDLYVQAISQWYEPEKSWNWREACQIEWVGSSIGRAPLELVRAWVNSYRPKNVAPPHSLDVRTALTVVEEWSRWVALCISAACVTRTISTVASISFDQIDLELAGAFVKEKIRDVADVERPRALGAFVANQIQCLQNVYEWALSVLQKRIAQKSLHGIDSKTLGQIRSAIAGAITGDGYLIIGFDEISLMPCEIGEEWLRAGKVDFLYPHNLFRHLVATQWTELGGDPRQVLIQLSHSTGYAHPFGGQSEISIQKFFQEAGATVDAVLTRIGFEPPECHFRPAVSSSLPGRRVVERQKRQFEEDLKKRNAEMSTRLKSLIYTEFAKKITNEWMIETNAATQGTSVEVPVEKLVQRTVVKAEEAIPRKANRVGVSIAVCNEVRRVARKHHIELSNDVPFYVISRREEAPVGAFGLSAARLMRMLRGRFVEYLVAESRTLDRDKPPLDDAFTNWLMLLLLYQPFASQQEMWRVFDSVQTASICETTRALWLRLDDNSACVLPAWFGAVLEPMFSKGRPAMSEFTAKKPERDVLVARGNAMLAKLGCEGEILDLLSWNADAARIEHPGIEWSILTGGLNAPFLHYQRARNFAAGGVGGEPVAAIGGRAGAENIAARRLVIARSDRSWETYKLQIQKCLRPDKQRTRSSKQKSTGNDKPETVKRTPKEAYKELEAIERKWSADPWSYPWLAEAYLKFVKSLVDEESRLDKKGQIQLGHAKTLADLVKNRLLPSLLSDPPESDDSEAWLDFYINAVEGLSAGQKSKAGNAFWRWHLILCDVIGAEPIPGEDWPFATLEKEECGPRCGGFVTEQEHDAVLALFDSWLEEAEQPGIQYDIAISRLIRTAKQVWLLSWNLGLRGPSEGFGIQHGDIESLLEETLLHIRNSSFYSLKTSAAERTYFLEKQVRITDLEAFRGWVDGEKLSAGDGLCPALHIFPELVGSKGAESRRFVLAMITAALRHVTNDQGARPHWGRRSFATRTAAPALALSGLPQVGGPKARPISCPLRDLSVAIGHVSLETTIQYYIFLRSFRANVPLPSQDKLFCAKLLGVTRYTYSTWSKSNEGRFDGRSPLVVRVFGTLRPVEKPPEGLGRCPVPVFGRPSVPGFMRIGFILHSLMCGATWEQAIWRAGYSATQQTLILDGLTRLMTYMPDLLGQETVDSVCRAKCSDSMGDQKNESVAIPSRRSLPELEEICSRLDRKTDRSKISDYAAAIERACLANDGQLKTRDRKITVFHDDDKTKIMEYLETVSPSSDEPLANRSRSAGFSVNCVKKGRRWQIRLRTYTAKDASFESRGVIFLLILALPMLLRHLDAPSN